MVTLKLLLHGMIVLVLDDPAAPKTLKAFLVEAGAWRQPASDQCVRHHHIPFLAFPMAGQKCPENGICEEREVLDPLALMHPPEKYCICDLNGRHIGFNPLPNDETAHPEWPSSLPKVPSSVGQANSIAWVPRMSHVDAVAAEPKLESILRKSTVADVAFSWRDIRTCELARIYNGPIVTAGMVPYFAFRPLGQSGPESPQKQALAEAIMATLEFNGSGPIEIKLSKSLALFKSIKIQCPGGDCGHVMIANAMVGDGREDGRCSDVAVGREFELYYESSDVALARPPLVPHLAGSLSGFFPDPHCPRRFRPDHIMDKTAVAGHSFRRWWTPPALAFDFKIIPLSTSGRPICTLVLLE